MIDHENNQLADDIKKIFYTALLWRLHKWNKGKFLLTGQTWFLGSGFFLLNNQNLVEQIKCEQNLSDNFFFNSVPSFYSIICSSFSLGEFWFFGLYCVVPALWG